MAVADRVGQQADAHAGAVDAELGAHRIEVEHRAHLGLDRADRRLRAVERMDRGQPRQRGEIGERGERDGGHQARVTQRYMLDPCAEGDGARHDVGRERREAQLRLGVAAAEPQGRQRRRHGGGAGVTQRARDPLQADFGGGARERAGGVAEQHQRDGQTPSWATGCCPPRPPVAPHPLRLSGRVIRRKPARRFSRRASVHIGFMLEPVLAQVRELHLADLLDIALVTTFVYSAIVLMRRTQARLVAIGILFLVRSTSPRGRSTCA